MDEIVKYTKTEWKDNSNPPINASNLNNIETGIDNATDGVNELVDEVKDNTSEISKNAESISNVKTQVEKNITNIATNKTNITENTKNIATNLINISNNKADITNLKTQVTSDEATISSNAENIATNKANIATNTSDIKTLKTKTTYQQVFNDNSPTDETAQTVAPTVYAVRKYVNNRSYSKTEIDNKVFDSSNIADASILRRHINIDAIATGGEASTDHEWTDDTLATSLFVDNQIAKRIIPTEEEFESLTDDEKKKFSPSVNSLIEKTNYYEPKSNKVNELSTLMQPEVEFPTSKAVVDFTANKIKENFDKYFIEKICYAVYSDFVQYDETGNQLFQQYLLNETTRQIAASNRNQRMCKQFSLSKGTYTIDYCNKNTTYISVNGTSQTLDSYVINTGGTSVDRSGGLIYRYTFTVYNNFELYVTIMTPDVLGAVTNFYLINTDIIPTTVPTSAGVYWVDTIVGTLTDYEARITALEAQTLYTAMETDTLIESEAT